MKSKFRENEKRCVTCRHWYNLENLFRVKVDEEGKVKKKRIKHKKALVFLCKTVITSLVSLFVIKFIPTIADEIYFYSVKHNKKH